MAVPRVTIDRTDVLVFDTGPLSHFAQQSWLGALKHVVGSRVAVIPDTVVAEIEAGVHGRAHLQMVLEAAWIERRTLSTGEELAEFARFASFLVADDRNIGECGVLCEAIREGALTVDLVSVVADDLIESEYRLPFNPGGFKQWAYDNGLVPPT